MHHLGGGQGMVRQSVHAHAGGGEIFHGIVGSCRLLPSFFGCGGCTVLSSQKDSIASSTSRPAGTRV